ncbi:cytochrome P450 [Blastococcus sp. CT_GayMR19]|uniref:cytochrome P450 n=1 Tax=Blastococcus sp. CT_GayMR19 TaxID=2559608 RepID=UPI0010748E3E|nr:cytochrome P450 [Blastococcus sp. CT_GayMR19]TFV77406.1 cytochrome P450 [Blastococcus sp. CT_GayMR19]
MSQDAIPFDEYEAVRKALYQPALSRTLDKRSFEEGNPRAGILSLLHGNEHRERRRLENALFRRQSLLEYEQVLFPKALAEVLDREATGRVDLFSLAGSASVVLAARRAGVDHDGSPEQLADLFEHVKQIAQAAAIHDIVGDRDRVQAETIASLAAFDRDYVTPSRRRREALLDAAEAGGTDDVPTDLLTAALRRLREGDDTFADHALLVREVGLFLHGGSHTSAQTVCNVLYFLFGLDGAGPRTEWLDRVAASRLDAQKCVHETLRLIPTTPEIKRFAEEDAEVGGVPIPCGATVALDARAANRDPDLFGADPDTFDPDRWISDDVVLWGHSFGAGPHICIGRSVAGGLPLSGAALRDGVGEEHLYGLIALMVQEVVARGVRPDPEQAPERDLRTSRGSRWLRFPVVFPGAGAEPTRAGIR